MEGRFSCVRLNFVHGVRIYNKQCCSGLEIPYFVSLVNDTSYKRDLDSVVLTFSPNALLMIYLLVGISSKSCKIFSLFNYRLSYKNFSFSFSSSQ